MATLKYTSELLREAVQSSVNLTQVLQRLGVRYSGGMSNHIRERIKDSGIDTSHFTGMRSTVGKPPVCKRHWAEVLIFADASKRQKSYRLTRALLESGRKHECEKCGSGPEWRGRKLVLEVDHIDGDWRDSRPSNVRFLCPNCHSQTENFYNSKAVVPIAKPRRAHERTNWPKDAELTRMIWNAAFKHRLVAIGLSKQRPHKD